ncbi:MAG: histone deacetylase [Candidatus Thorarchaeota archaeon]|nr:MAG: histone deacetylase [Candidatus Thorarchaeota archaeon]
MKIQDKRFRIPMFRTRVPAFSYNRLCPSDLSECVESFCRLETVLMTTDLVYHDTFVKHEISVGHPESPDRLRSAMNYTKKAGLFENNKLNLFTPEPVDLELVYTIHDRKYLEGVREKSKMGGGFYTLDTAVNQYTFEAALLAAGGGVGAVDRIMAGTTKNAFVLCRPPGHHAEFERAFGFCFINNIAVAANHLLKNHGLKRIMIVDYDAHHGNGTQNSFYSSNQVLYVGLHQDGRTLVPGSGFPDEIGKGEGQGYTLNIAMYPGAGDKSYELAFSKVIEPLAESFKPEFILVSVGFDAHYKDPLTSLGLTTTGFAMMNSRLNQIASSVTSGKLACFLEGGYNLDVMGMCTQNLLEELVGIQVSKFDEHHTESENCTKYTEDLIEHLTRTSPLL